jgi:hypothetical protein
MSVLTFLHTAAVHVDTFGKLVQALDSSVPVQHVVRPDLLADALSAGVTSESVRTAVTGVLEELARAGATVIVCTCSTLGAVAEAATVPQCTVVRIDRAVAERAVASGRRILLVAALPTALGETRALLRAVSSHAPQPPDIVEVLCSRAWQFFERGDTANYLAAIVETIHATAVPGDLVLLAQASMSPAAQLVTRSDVTILSSPELGVAAAIAAYKAGGRKS